MITLLDSQTLQTHDVHSHLGMCSTPANYGPEGYSINEHKDFSWLGMLYFLVQ